MLKEFGRNIGPVIHITREKEEVIRYLIDEKDRPQWGEDMRTGTFEEGQACTFTGRG